METLSEAAPSELTISNARDCEISKFSIQWPRLRINITPMQPLGRANTHISSSLKEARTNRRPSGSGGEQLESIM